MLSLSKLDSQGGVFEYLKYPRELASCWALFLGNFMAAYLEPPSLAFLGMADLAYFLSCLSRLGVLRYDQTIWFILKGNGKLGCKRHDKSESSWQPEMRKII